jgi:hypothetical protein
VNSGVDARRERRNLKLKIEEHGGREKGQRRGEVDKKLSTSIPLHVSSGDTSKV